MTLEMFALGFVLPRVTLTISTIAALFLLVCARVFGG